MYGRQSHDVGRVAQARPLGSLDRLILTLAGAGRGHKQTISMALDAALSALALWGAYSLRRGELYDGFADAGHLFVVMPLLTLVVFAASGLYRWVVRSSNRRFYARLAKACVVTAAALGLLTHLFPPDPLNNPRSLFVIYLMLLGIGTGGLRLLWSGFFDVGTQGEPVAIYGAGATGQWLARTLQERDEFRPVAFIDDNASMRRSTVAGLPVLDGGAADLDKALARVEAGLVILAMPSMAKEDYRARHEKLTALGLTVRTVPSLSELFAGTAGPAEVRDVSIKDILGRSEIAADPQLIARRVTGKAVLVTGGGGSIGSELCRQILRLGPSRLVVLDNSEFNLYRVSEELGPKVGAAARAHPFHPVLCSVTDRARVRAVLREHGVQTIYHAAAYKHVPIVEAFPEQGVDVNVFGTLAVLEEAIDAEVADFVLISTDKAVRPANAMGASKRAAELILQSKAREAHATRVSMVRFGNVLGSSGSVVPKFKRQILEGGPVTITHPDVTRFFMTIPEAAQLVLQASAIADGGDVFVLDMGEPVRIEELATSMVRLYGRRLRRETGREDDIEIVAEGLRPGEKMFEELFLGDERRATEVPKVFAAREAWLPWEELCAALEELRMLALVGDSDGLRGALLRLARAGVSTDHVAVPDRDPDVAAPVAACAVRVAEPPALACERRRHPEPGGSAEPERRPGSRVAVPEKIEA